MDIGFAESGAVVEAGGVIREVVVDADGKAFITGMVEESAESTSVEIPTLLGVLSKGLEFLVGKSAIYNIVSIQYSPFSSFS